MLVITVIAVFVGAASLAAGLAVRWRLARCPVAPAALPGTARQPGIGTLDRWRGMSRTLLSPERGIVALVVWLMLLDTALALAAPWPLMLVVDHGLSHHPYPAWLSGLAGISSVQLAFVAAAAGLLLLTTSATAGYLVTFLMGAVGERVTVRLRVRIVGHVLRAAPHRVAAYPLGELTSRVGTDAGLVADTVVGITETVIPDLTVLAGMIAITAVLDWRLTLVVLGVIPLYALTALLRNRSLRGAQQEARARSGDLAAIAADLLARIPAIHVFDHADAEAGRYGRAGARSASASIAALDASARYSPLTDSLPGLGLAAALIAGTIEVTSGRRTVGGLLVLLAYLSSLTAPVRSLARLSTTIAAGTASRERVAELLSLPCLQPDASKVPSPVGRPQARRAGSPAPARRGALRPGLGLPVGLTSVAFAHRAGQPVLAGVNLHVGAGELLCITGPSGGGKSTLLSLLVRLADPQAGLITIGGHDIARLSLAQLRQTVTLVPQDPWLHTGTIADNISYGRPGASHGEILAAAESAGVASFADALRDGYDTPVGEHGRQLSGGQQRRIAIARALLRDTPVLLLDEPTTGLDPVTESCLVTELLAAARGKTVILVTHQARLSAMADRVVTLDQGRIAPAGSPVTVPSGAAAAGPAIPYSAGRSSGADGTGKAFRPATVCPDFG